MYKVELYFAEGARSSLLKAIGSKQRKVWTSQERIPVNGWESKDYGKCNRKHSADH